MGEQVSLATAMVVREDSLTLFGFADYDERALFELLQTASGVGPKLAQAMLAVHGPDEVRRAVMTEDLTALCKVPGIGRKGAQRVVLELKDRIGAPRGTPAVGTSAAPESAAGWRGPVRSGLLGLGWSTKETEQALEAIAPMADEATSDGGQAPIAELLRAALQSLSRA
jgi:Holliday junction DNA helicase RuvA